MKRTTKNQFFLAHGWLIWLPSKIAAQILTVLLFLATAGTPVDIVDASAYVDLPAEQVVLLGDAEQRLAEIRSTDVPDPEPPTTASNWSEMVRVPPYRPTS